MNKTLPLTLLLLLLSSAAYAHKDSIITLNENGTITNLPPPYAPAALQIENSFFGNALTSIKLSVGKSKLTFPGCLLSLIKSDNKSQVHLSGSWYHENSLTPHYLHIMFYDPGHEESQNPNPGYKFLINMQTLKIMRMEYISVNVNGISNHQKLTPSDICKNNELATTLDPVQY
ncbi:hypothetical protein [Pseudomonas sp. 1928-m]|uniref:hypothetical protein n=1 Tax=Pseudomonas sp. 1928-m TaxID=3033804 RepID=UPI0023DEE367|nr:hypothetical protein [Pseudomonas sp. 1928-m]MDF3197028.1 hypothetical protein [Pseudomonas sp. 1928-m]